jgi:hypothetical protein
MSPHQSLPQTHPTIVFQDLLASHQSSASRHPVTTLWHVAITRLHMDLTCPRVSSTHRHMYAPQWCMAFPDSSSTTLLHYSSYFWRLVVFWFVFMMHFRCFVCVPWFFCIFCWSSLFLLFFFLGGFYC